VRVVIILLVLASTVGAEPLSGIAKLVVPPLFVWGGNITNHADTDRVSITSQLVVRSIDNKVTIVLPAGAEIDMTTTGAGGRNTGSRDAGDWHIYAISRAEGADPQLVASLQDESAGDFLTMPDSVYVHKRQLAISFFDSGSAITPFESDGQWPHPRILYQDAMPSDVSTDAGNTRVAHYNSSIPTDWTDVSLASYVPTSSKTFLLHASATMGTTFTVIQLRQKCDCYGHHTGYDIVGQTRDFTSEYSSMSFPEWIKWFRSDYSNRTIQLRMESGDTDSAFTLNVVGYICSEVP